MLAFKLPVLFFTLYFLAFNVTVHGKVLNHGNKISKLPSSSIVYKNCFVGYNRKKPVESLPTTTLSEVNNHKNVVLSKLLDKRNRNLVLVTGGTLVFAVTLYRCVSRLVRYFLYDKYVTKNSPGVVNTLGHVLLKNSNFYPNDLFMSKVVKPLSKTFEKVPFLKGLFRPGMVRVSTSSVLDKDTYVLLYFYNSYNLPQYKKIGFDVLESMRSAYESLKKSGKKVEVVTVDVSRSSDQCYETFKGLPWYSIPFEDLNRKQWLLEKFDVYSHPRLVLLDQEGNVVQDRCLNMLMYRVNDFPWNNMKLQDLLPNYLYDSNNNPVHKNRLEGKLVGLFYDTGNPELRNKIKKRVSDFYEFMNKETNGNFEIVVINSDYDNKDFEESLKTYHPSWLSIKFNDTTDNTGYLSIPVLHEHFSLDPLNRLVLLDQEGNVYANNVHLFLEENFYKDLYEEYTKGANKVKGEKLSYLHLLNVPVLTVFADNEDQKTSEKLEEEMNSAFAKHRNKRKTTLVQFMILKDKELIKLLRKTIKSKKEKMVLFAKTTKPLLYNGEVNEKSMLELLDRFYKQGLNN